LYELIHSYELSPKLSDQILISAKTSLLRTKELRESQLVAVVVDIDKKSGKPIEKMKKKRVVLTLNNGLEYMSSLEQFGRSGLRQVIIQRITDEACRRKAAKRLFCVSCHTLDADGKFLSRCSLRGDKGNRAPMPVKTPIQHLQWVETSIDIPLRFSEFHHSSSIRRCSSARRHSTHWRRVPSWFS